MSINKHICKICKTDLKNPKHKYCNECLGLVREDLERKEEDIIAGKMDREIGIVDRTEWT